MSLADFIAVKREAQKRLNSRAKVVDQKDRTSLRISPSVYILVAAYAAQHNLTLRRAAEQLVGIGYGYQTGTLSCLEDADDD